MLLCLQACKIVEGQRYTKRLNEKQITALLKVTCQRPRDRENDILQVILGDILRASLCRVNIVLLLQFIWLLQKISIQRDRSS